MKTTARHSSAHRAPHAHAKPGHAAHSPAPVAPAAKRAQPTDTVHHRQKRRGTPWKDYLPLIVILTLTVLAASAKQVAAASAWDGRGWMHDFMGLFLVVFSMFKFFNLAGFADGFQMYDLLAKPFRPYAYVYPFIELGLGLGYLAQRNLPVVYGATIVVMLFGALGVIRALRQGLDLECACMGTVLKVPLSTVALTEDLGMVAMAATMWATHA
ncbi:MAG: hypothetical protein Q8N18_26210 [Opitutaceae bacterium]|nr:hypothetical protein [Opitutaceae bacterium]